ncbi:MAG: hypothetical protein IKZ42_05160 [Clostridiales bacterium]|nr:hypothetical protein [Clostridiales bacterium]
MPDNRGSNRGQRHPNVRSADSAVVKAVEHQAALERQAQQRQEQARLARNQAMPQRMPRPANVTRPTYQRPAQAMPQRQAQPMQRPAQPMNVRQPIPQQRPVQAMPQRQAQPMPQRQVQPSNVRQPMPRNQGQAVLRREAQPIVQPVPQRLQIPQQQRPANQAMPVLHTSTQQLNTRMPVPHLPAQSPNVNMPVVRSVPQTVAMPRHLSNPGSEQRSLEPLMNEVHYEETDEDGIVEVDSEFEEFDDDEEEEVVEKKHRKAREPKQRKHRSLPYLIVLLLVILFAIAAVWAITVFNEDTDLIVTQNTIEAGTSADLSMYLTGNPRFPEYVSCNLDFSTVNYILPQTIRFTIRMYGVNFPCVLEIVDTTPPTAEAVPHEMFSIDAIPPVEECVKNVYDLNDVTVKWKEVPDISGGGNIIAKASVTDSSGNETIVDVPFQVTKDSIAPVIEGTKDIEAFVGDAITYRSEVTVTDDLDPNPRLEIDTSKVNLKEAGTYEVVYRATDFTGNTTEVTIKLKLEKKPKTYVDPSTVENEAKKILNKITKPGMSDMEKALQITWWVRYNINYVQRADNSSWTRAAYDGLVKRQGNCYNFAMTAKALFDAAGIENMIITREPFIYHGHYWNYINIDGEWYHCDSTPRKKYNSYFFMYTTKELKNFWHNGWNGYNFKEEKYPKSATKSVQSKINYGAHKLK